MNQADAALTHLSPRSLRCRFGGGDRPNGEAASVEDVDSWSGVSGRGRSSVVVVESVRCRLCRDSDEAEVDSCGGSFVSDIEFADYCLSRERERASTGARASSRPGGERGRKGAQRNRRLPRLTLTCSRFNQRHQTIQIARLRCISTHHTSFSFGHLIELVKMYSFGLTNGFDLSIATIASHSRVCPPLRRVFDPAATSARGRFRILAGFAMMICAGWWATIAPFATEPVPRVSAPGHLLFDSS